MKANRKDLLMLLKSLSPGLKDFAGQGERMDCYVFRGGRVTTFNDEVACSIESPLPDVEGRVPAKKLVELLDKLAGDELDVSAKDGEFRVRAGRSERSGIPMESGAMPDVPPPKKWRKLSPDFCEALAAVKRCTATVDDKPVLTHVHVCPEHVEASDDYQMIRWPMPVGVGGSCLVGRGAAGHVAASGAAEVSEMETWMHFRNPDGLVLSCLRWVEDFPKLDDYLDVSGERFEFPKGFAEAMGKAGLFGAGDGNCMVWLKDGSLRVRGEGEEGWYEKRSRIEYGGKPISFSADHKLLVEASRLATGCTLSENCLGLDVENKFRYVVALNKVGD